VAYRIDNFSIPSNNGDNVMLMSFIRFFLAVLLWCSGVVCACNSSYLAVYCCELRGTSSV